MPSEKMNERNKKEYVKFFVGSKQRTIRVLALPKNIIEIQFDEIKSSKTRKNLLTLKHMYNIEWITIIRYPVLDRFGYIVYGLLGKQGLPVTYIRKEVNSHQSGSTDLWFDGDYMIPALKLIQSHEYLNKKFLYWGKDIKEESVRKWHELVHDENVLMSYQISKYIHGNDDLRTNYFRNRKMLETRLIDYFTELAKKLDSDRLMELIAILQKIQFEKLV